MSDRYRLVDVESSELLTAVSRLVRRGNEITAEVLAHLSEIEDRMLHLEIGFPSLFAYCVELLGMSEGAAGRRVAAARVCRRFPEVFGLVVSGELHLSAVCALAPHLESSNATVLFDVCRHKTRRQVDELLAERFPKADVREQIRRMPSQEIEPLGGELFGVHFTADSELCALFEQARAIASHRLPGGDLASLMKLVFAQFVKSEEARRFAVGRKARRIATENASRVIAAKRARDGNKRSIDSRHTVPPAEVPGNAELRAHFAQPEDEVPTKEARGEVSVMEVWAHATNGVTGNCASGGIQISARIDTLRISGTFHASSAAKKPTPPGGVPRSVRAAVRREVYTRDEGRCSFVAANGRRCESRARLELDHVEPWAMRGSAEGDNLRLRCRAHNALHARHCFGTEYVAAKIAARRAGRCTEKSAFSPRHEAETYGMDESENVEA